MREAPPGPRPVPCCALPAARPLHTTAGQHPAKCCPACAAHLGQRRTIDGLVTAAAGCRAACHGGGGHRGGTARGRWPRQQRVQRGRGGGGGQRGGLALALRVGRAQAAGGVCLHGKSAGTASSAGSWAMLGQGWQGGGAAAAPRAAGRGRAAPAAHSPGLGCPGSCGCGTSAAQTHPEAAQEGVVTGWSRGGHGVVTEAGQGECGRHPLMMQAGPKDMPGRNACRRRHAAYRPLTASSWFCRGMPAAPEAKSTGSLQSAQEPGAEQGA